MTFVVRYWCVVASHKIVFKMSRGEYEKSWRREPARVEVEVGEEEEVCAGLVVEFSVLSRARAHLTAATRYLICNCFCPACHMALKSSCKL